MDIMKLNHRAWKRFATSGDRVQAAFYEGKNAGETLRKTRNPYPPGRRREAWQEAYDTEMRWLRIHLSVMNSFQGDYA